MDADTDGVTVSRETFENTVEPMIPDGASEEVRAAYKEAWEQYVEDGMPQLSEDEVQALIDSGEIVVIMPESTTE